MALPKVQGCCFCFSLRTGVIIISVCTLLFGVLNLINNHGSPQFIIHGIISTLIGIILLAGTFTRKATVLLLGLVLFTVYNVYSLFEPFLYNGEMNKIYYKDTGTRVGHVVLGGIFTAYFCLVIYSLYKSFKE